MSRRLHSVTTLDEYTKYLSGEHQDTSEYTTEEWIQWLTQGFQPTPKMEAGTAVHQVIELAQYGDQLDEVMCNGWLIRFELDATLELPEFRETRLRREHNGFEIRGRADSLTATSVRDVKTTSAIDLERYINSYQWRTYLWITGASRFVYDVFRVSVDEDNMEVTVKEYVPMEITRYPDLDKDVESLIDSYVDCLKHLKLLEHEHA